MIKVLKSNFFNNAVFIFALVVLAYSCANLQTFPDLDLWARLSVGSIFWQTGHVLTHDIFSYLPHKLLFIDHEWGSGVIFYTIVKYFGDMGLFWLKFALIFSIFYLISKTIRLNKQVRCDNSAS